MEMFNQYFKSDRIREFYATNMCANMNVYYYMYITGYNSLYPCIMILIANNNNNFELTT